MRYFQRYTARFSTNSFPWNRTYPLLGLQRAIDNTAIKYYNVTDTPICSKRRNNYEIPSPGCFALRHRVAPPRKSYSLTRRLSSHSPHSTHFHFSNRFLEVTWYLKAWTKSASTAFQSRKRTKRWTGSTRRLLTWYFPPEERTRRTTCSSRHSCGITETGSSTVALIHGEASRCILRCSVQSAARITLLKRRSNQIIRKRRPKDLRFLC